jgi:hypothetical protein
MTVDAIVARAACIFELFQNSIKKNKNRKEKLKIILR